MEACPFFLVRRLLYRKNAFYYADAFLTKEIFCMFVEEILKMSTMFLSFVVKGVAVILRCFTEERRSDAAE